MSTLLSINEKGQNLPEFSAGEQTEKANQVKKLGIIALVLLVCSLIPIVGFFTLIASFIISRRALKISRENLVPVEYERPAYWASVISLLLMITTVIGIVLMIM